MITSAFIQFCFYWLAILLIVLVLALPYVVKWTATFVLRDAGFKAQVGGFASLKNVYFKYRVKMNLQALIYIKEISISVNFPKSFDEILTRQSSNKGWLSLCIDGLQVNFLLKNDFKTWGSQDTKIDLIEIIKSIRRKLEKDGVLKDPQLKKAEAEDSNSQTEIQKPKDSREDAPSKKNIFLQVHSTFKDSEFNFFVYKQDSSSQLSDLDQTNTKQFWEQNISNVYFQRKNIMMKIQAPSTKIHISKFDDENCELDIQIPQLLLKHPLHKHKCGLLNKVEISVQVPVDRAKLKLISNYEFRIQVQNGVLNLNKKFTQSFINFFVYLETLLVVIKGIRKLVLKQHYQNKLMVQSVNRQRTAMTTQYRNYRDTVIPSFFQISFKQGLHLIVTDDSQKLKKYLGDPQNSQLFYARFSPSTSLEFVRAPADSYYINFKSQSVNLDMNCENVLKVKNFTQEANLTFLRENTELEVKKGKLIFQQNLKFERVEVQMNPSFFKACNEIKNFYLKSKYIAGIKHTVLGRLVDRTFLLDQIIADQIDNWGDSILEVYEPLKHQDIFKSSVQITNLKLKHLKKSQEMGLLSNLIEAQVEKLNFCHVIDQGTIMSDFKCQKLSVIPIRREQNDIDILPLLSASQLKFQKYQILPTSPLNQDDTNLSKKQYTIMSCLEFNVCLNLEIILDHTAEIQNYQRIQEYFEQKWSNKYNLSKTLQESYKNAVNLSGPNRHQIGQFKVENRLNAVFIQKCKLHWYMSRLRIMTLALSDFRPLNDNSQTYQQHLLEPLDQLVKKGLVDHLLPFKDKEGNVTIKMGAANGQLIHKYKDKLQQVIVDTSELQWNQISTKEHQDFVFRFLGFTTFTIPHDFHYSAFMNECIKQINHTINYFRQQSKGEKEKPSLLQNLPLIRKWRSLSLVFEFEQGVLNFLENPVKHTFLAKNDIVETISERDIMKLKPAAAYSLVNKIKKSGIYNYYLSCEVQKFKFQWQKPASYKNEKTCLEKMAELDEGDRFFSKDLFYEIKPSIFTFSADYSAVCGRSFFKPIFQAWGWKVDVLAIFGVLNPENQSSYYTAEIEQKIFRKFPIPTIFNRMVSKLYFQGSINFHKLQFSAQGQQTKLFLNDISQALERLFSFVDISQSKDPKKEFLPYLTGFDKFRHKNHGKLKIEINKCQIEIYPKRRINKFTDKLLLEFHDFQYGQKNLTDMERKARQGIEVFWQHFLVLRQFQIQREPLRQFETGLFRLPLFELQFCLNYNDGKTINHYLHQKASTKEGYFKELRNYLIKNMYVEIKLNLPSFGPINTTKGKSLFLPQFLQSYVSSSPVPIINYQRSYLQLLDEIAREYVNGGKIDITGRVRRRKESRINPSLIKAHAIAEVKVNISSFLSDFLLMFTDFDEAGQIFGEQKLDQQIIDPEMVDKNYKRDNYLARYQGLISSFSNIQFKSECEVKKGKERRRLKSLNTKFSSSFMRLSAINTESLFNIRPPSADDNKIHAFSMDNYKQFSMFFEIFEQRKNKDQIDYEKLLNGFKTLFPQYIFDNEEIRHAIAEATGQYEQYQRDDLFSSGSMQVEDYFKFSENDTICIVSSVKYTQNDRIEWSEQLFDNRMRQKRECETHQQNSQDFDEEIEYSSYITVRHCLKINQVRILFTSKIQEQIVHLLIKSFDFKQFRKTKYADLVKKSAQAQARDFLKEYKLNSDNPNKPKCANNALSEHLEKVAFFAFILKDPQISCQNMLTKSQILCSLKQETILMIHAYSINQETLKSNKNFYFDLLANYQLTKDDVVKYEVKFNIADTDIYVALNTDQDIGTFWTPNFNQSILGSCSNLENGDLKCISKIHDMSIQIELIHDTYVDYETPIWSIDYVVQKIECDMDGPSMWHSVSVANIALFGRGEKSNELVFIEEAKIRDLNAHKLTELRDMIDQEVQKSKFQLKSDNVRPDMSKKLVIRIIQFEFTFKNNNNVFVSGLMENLQAKHRIYVNRESNSDIDIHRITCENHCDTEEYRMVLQPSSQTAVNFYKKKNQLVQIQVEKNEKTFIKLRCRDKFVVVKEAPWRVYDQIEIFIHPSQISLTQNFYNQWLVFFFENNPFAEDDIKQGQNHQQSFMKTARFIQSQVVKATQRNIQALVRETGLKQEGQSAQNEPDPFCCESSIIEKNQGSSSGGHSSDFLQSNSNSQALLYAGTQQTSQTALQQAFPNFFRYMRINEIQVQISYFHAKAHMKNIQNFKLKLPAYISHGTFTTFRKALESYEKHSKNSFISQIPNLLYRKAIQVKQQVKKLTDEEVIKEQDDQEQKELRRQTKQTYARKIIQGDFAL